jgi:uncharacterized protein
MPARSLSSGRSTTAVAARRGTTSKPQNGLASPPTQGDAAAQFRLGLMYSEGHGVPQDHAEAAEWYQRAANERYAQAQYNLGLLYANGEGVAQDNVQAHLWFNLAAVHFPASDTRNRNAALNSRDVVARKLTREQLAEAQKLAREWKPVRLAQHGGGTS